MKYPEGVQVYNGSILGKEVFLNHTDIFQLYTSIVLHKVMPERVKDNNPNSLNVLVVSPKGNGRRTLARFCVAESKCRAVEIDFKKLKGVVNEEVMEEIFGIIAKTSSHIVVLIDMENAIDPYTHREPYFKLSKFILEERKTCSFILISSSPWKIPAMVVFKFSIFYHKLPDSTIRKEMLVHFLDTTSIASDLGEIVARTQGYSYSELTNLLTLIRLQTSAKGALTKDLVLEAIKKMPPSLSSTEVEHYLSWTPDLLCPH
eukprot:TRINITY_DN17112_c0_g1_i1.p1 TRINITY_DN17112_c0_g1~~TRINITY_DN17112_c0_g1_i1.p1  ORF type:complete len:260 (+),score=40.35 TRINITY_DN17112_c0_g1_i1:147-926(+)